MAVAVGNVVVFSSTGAGLWGAKMLTSILAGMAVPALGVYAAELFPTSRRGGANGGISALSIVGSVAGLLLAGQLLDQGVTYGTVMAILALGPLIYAALVVFAYPETARRPLDDINPEDRASAVARPSARRPARPPPGRRCGASAPLRSWRPPSIHSWVTGPGDGRPSPRSSSSGAPNGIPGALARTGTARPATAGARSAGSSGLPGGWSG